MDLKELQKSIAKNIKGVHCELITNSTITKVEEWVETPSYDLNRILSGSLYKGIPAKTLVGLVGPEASFKSSFMCLCMVNAQKKGYKTIVIDTEGAWNDDFITRWGLDPEKTLYIYSPFVDQAIGVVGNIFNEGDEKYFICQHQP